MAAVFTIAVSIILPPLHTMAPLGNWLLSAPLNLMDGTSFQSVTLQVANKPQLRTATAITKPVQSTVSEGPGGHDRVRLSTANPLALPLGNLAVHDSQPLPKLLSGDVCLEIRDKAGTSMYLVVLTVLLLVL